MYVNEVGKTQELTQLNAASADSASNTKKGSAFGN